MKRFARRLLKLCSAISLLLCVAVCMAWVFTQNQTLAVFRTSWTKVSEAHDAEGAQTHWLGSCAGRVHYFHKDDLFIVYIPTITGGGALYGVTSEDPSERTDFWDETRIWTHAGVEVWAGPPPNVPPTRSSLDIPWRRVTVPHWMLAVVTAVLPLSLAVRGAGARFRRKVRASRGYCAQCGYDLRASPKRCPECGTPAASRGGCDT